MANQCIPILNGHALTTQQIINLPAQVVENTSRSPFADVGLMRRSYWSVLQAIGKLTRSRAIEIGEETGLAVSTVLKSAQELQLKGLIVSASLPGTETRAKPTLVFSLSPGITPDLIAAEMEQIGQAAFQGKNKKQKKGKNQKSYISSTVQAETNSVKSFIYGVIRESGGCTATEIIEKTGLTTGVVQGCLGRLFRNGEITRTRNTGKTVLEYIYAIPSNTFSPGKASSASEGVKTVVPSPQSAQFLGQEPANSLTTMEPTQQELSVHPSANAAQATIWEVVEAMAQRIFDLESRFEKIEQTLQGSSSVKAEEILSLLRKKG